MWGALPAFVGAVAASMPAPSGAAYSPLDEGGMVYWADFHDAATYTLSGGSSGNFTALVNKASAVALTVRSDPEYNATGINGVPCATLDSGDWFTCEESGVYSVASGPAESHTFTLFVVGSTPLVAAETRRLCGWGVHASTVGRIGIGQSSDGVWFASDVGAGSALLSGVVNDSAAHVHEFYASDAVFSYRLDGAELTLTGDGAYGGTYTPSQFDLGRWPQSTSFSVSWQGNVGDCLIYNSVLSSEARGRVRAYLGTKYAISVV